MLLKKELISFLNKKFPQKNAEEWDFVGYSIKNKNEKIKSILLALDVDKECVNHAIKNKIDIIISFHPFRFGKTWNEIYQYDKSKIELVERLKENNISVFSIHTNFDLDAHGTKYWIYQRLDWNNKIIKTYPYYSIVKYHESFETLVQLLKEKLDVNFLISNFDNAKIKNKKINNVAFWPGSGDIYQMINQGDNIDVLITSDIKWNDQQVLNYQGINFIMICHKIENIFVDAMEQIISQEFKNKLKVIKFKKDDFLKIY